MLAHDFHLIISVGSIAVERYNYTLSELLEVLDMAVKVLQSLDETFCIWFLDFFYRHATVHLQSLCGSHDDCELRLKT